MKLVCSNVLNHFNTSPW